MADRYLFQNAGMFTEREGATTGGSANAGKIPALDSNGRFDSTMLPVGTGTDTNPVQASEAIAAGAAVNVYYTGTAWRVRNADASVVGKHAHGYVRAAAASGAVATVFAEGTNDQVTGLVAADLFLSATTPGAVTGTSPTGSGQVVQRVGYAVSGTAYNFQFHPPVVLA